MQYTHGYFTARFYCIITPQEITVSLSAQGTTCFELMQEFTTREDKLEEDVARAMWFMQNGIDTDYREWVVRQLRQQQHALTTLRTNLLFAIEDFERDLFRRIHSLVRFQLQEEREMLFMLSQEYSDEIIAARQRGDAGAYISAVRKKELLQVRILFLDNIFFARTFDQLMPVLKEYLWLQHLRVSLPEHADTASSSHLPEEDSSLLPLP